MTERVNLLCWEGYDSSWLADHVRRASDIELKAQILYSDFATAEYLQNTNEEHWDILNIR